MEDNTLHEKVINIITEVMEVTEHQRKFDYWNDKTINGKSYTDPKIWYKGNHDLYSKIETAKRQILLGESELASYTLYQQYLNICEATIPNIITPTIEEIIKIKTLVTNIIDTYKNTSVSDADRYKYMFKSLDMELLPNEMGNFYGQLSETITQITNSYKSEYGMLKTYHAYGSDTIPFDAKFETPLTILSGYYPEIWLDGLITSQKSKTAEEMDDMIRINLYNSKDVFDPTYEYFIIAVTYKSTLFVINDEIKHPNIWARFSCRARNNRRAEDRFEKLTLPYDAIANFEVARKNDNNSISKIKTLTFSKFADKDEDVSLQAIKALSDLGHIGVRLSEIKSRGNYQSIVSFFNSDGDNIAIGNITRNFSDDNSKDLTLTIFDKLIVADTIDIKTLENFEKMFFPVFGLAFRSILSSMDGDYSSVQKGEFGSKQLLLNSGNSVNDTTTFDWNVDFDPTSTRTNKEARFKYVNRFLKHAKQLEDSGLFTGKELTLIDKISSLQLNHESALRHTKDTSDFGKIFPVIGALDSVKNQEIWLSLENERARIQSVFNKLEEHYFKRNDSGYSDRRSSLYMEIGEHIYEHKDNFIKYAFGIITDDVKFDSNVSCPNTGDSRYSKRPVRHIKNANQNNGDNFSTWRCQFLLHSRKDYMRSGKTRRDNMDCYSVYDKYEEESEMNFCRVIVSFYSAEQLCEALGHESVDQLPLAWRSFLHNDFKMRGGNSNLDNVHPFTEIHLPKTFTETLNIGLVISKHEYVNLIKSKGVSHVGK